MDYAQDWKGNIIREGDKIILVKVFEPAQEYAFGFIELGKPFREVNRTFIPAKEYLWEPGREYQVIEEGPLYLGEDCKEVPVNMVSWILFGLPQGYIVCIKDKSFDRDEYYLDKFRVD
jgi:hypothetical protein